MLLVDTSVFLAAADDNDPDHLASLGGVEVRVLRTQRDQNGTGSNDERGHPVPVRVHPTHQSSRLGVLAAMTALERIGWGPIENSTQDLGTDLLIHARDHRQFERGQ